jgi:hypothetical protein
MKVAMFDRFPLVMVDWVDSHMTSGWHQLEDIESTADGGAQRTFPAPPGGVVLPN